MTEHLTATQVRDRIERDRRELERLIDLGKRLHREVMATKMLAWETSDETAGHALTMRAALLDQALVEVYKNQMAAQARVDAARGA